MAEIDQNKQIIAEAMLDYYKQQVDFWVEKKVTALEELVRQAKKEKIKSISEKIKE